MRECAFYDQDWKALLNSSKSEVRMENDVLFWLAEGGQHEILKDIEVDIKAKDKDGNTIFLRACKGML